MLASSLFVLASLALPAVLAQSDDVIWHNRYHAILAMSSYGDYNTLCPQQTFTEEAKLKNFPNSTLPNWEILEEWGPTASGSQGYSVLVPEMAKVVLVFKGNYSYENTLPTDTIPISVMDPDYTTKSIDFAALRLSDGCTNCRANAFAMQGYLEAKAATNNFAVSVAKYQEIHESEQFYYSITGHGLGGMHAIIAGLDLGLRNISFFLHSYGAPRTLSPESAGLYNFLAGGDMTERGIGNGDALVEQIPQSDDYMFTNTAFLWYGYNATYKMNREVCYEQPESDACAPTQSQTPQLDRYFYFANVGQCGGRDRQDTAVGHAYIDSVSGQNLNAADVPITLTAAAPAATSLSSSTVSSDVSAPTSIGVVSSSGDSSAPTSASVNAAGANAAAQNESNLAAATGSGAGFTNTVSLAVAVSSAFVFALSLSL